MKIQELRDHHEGSDKTSTVGLPLEHVLVEEQNCFFEDQGGKVPK